MILEKTRLKLKCSDFVRHLYVRHFICCPFLFVILELTDCLDVLDALWMEERQLQQMGG